jgi:hypothetical protein
MARVHLAGALLAVCVTAASAGPTRRVTIDTDPEGATVYFNDRDSRPVCERTPCSVDAPIGQTTIVIELRGYGPVIDQLEVAKKGKLTNFKFQLSKATDDPEPATASSPSSAGVGTIVIDASSAKGATVNIDGADKGKVPLKIEVDPGTRVVVVIKDGLRIFDKKVQVEAGEELRVTPRSGSTAAAVSKDSVGGKSRAKDRDTDRDRDQGKTDRGDKDDKDERTDKTEKPDKKERAGRRAKDKDTASTETEGETSTETGEDGSKRGIEKTGEPEEPRDRLFVVSGVLDIGFRDFTYAGGTHDYANYDQAESGQALGGIAVEVWPAEVLGATVAHGLSLFGRYELPLVHQTVLDSMNMSTGIATDWRTFELSARYRQVLFDGAVAVSAGVGYLNQKMGYSGNDPAELARVPVVDYKSIVGRIGVALPIDPIEPYVVGEPRLVRSAGDLALRFTGAKIAAYRVGVGAALRYKQIVGHVEASYEAYVWSNLKQDPDAINTASGASDKVMSVSAMVGYSY